jgi:hypothetical protein
MNEFYEIEEVENGWIITPLQRSEYWIGYPIKCQTEADATRVALVLSAQDLITKGMREALKKVAIENARKEGAWRSE